MRKIIFCSILVIALVAFTFHRAFALVCPAVTPGPIAESSQATTILAAVPLTVIIGKNISNPIGYYIVCQYQIEGGQNPVSLNVANRHLNWSSDPTNPNFKKISESMYRCTTDTSHPEKCSESDVHPIVCGMGQPC